MCHNCIIKDCFVHNISVFVDLLGLVTPARAASVTSMLESSSDVHRHHKYDVMCDVRHRI